MQKSFAERKWKSMASIPTMIRHYLRSWLPIASATSQRRCERMALATADGEQHRQRGSPQRRCQTASAPLEWHCQTVEAIPETTTITDPQRAAPHITQMSTPVTLLSVAPMAARFPRGPKRSVLWERHLRLLGPGRTKTSIVDHRMPPRPILEVAIPTLQANQRCLERRPDHNNTEREYITMITCHSMAPMVTEVMEAWHNR